VLCVFLLFCTITNKSTIITQIITLLEISTRSCHRQGACNQYLAKLTQVLQMQLLAMRFTVTLLLPYSALLFLLPKRNCLPEQGLEFFQQPSKTKGDNVRTSNFQLSGPHVELLNIRKTQT